MNPHYHYVQKNFLLQPAHVTLYRKAVFDYMYSPNDTGISHLGAAGNKQVYAI